MPLNVDRRMLQGWVVAGLVFAALISGFATLNWGLESIDLPLMYLQHILYGPFDYWVVPEEYQLLSTANVTPWSSFSLGVTYEIFGLDPYGARLHHLLSYTLLVVLLAIVALRLTSHPLLAFVAVAFLMTSDPFIAIRDSLICRHYLEGMIAALCSIALYERFIRRRNPGFLVASVLFFIVAVTAKEVYAPLPALLFFIGNVPLLRRVGYAMPFALVCIGYIVWRSHLLGGFGGYGGAIEGESLSVMESLGYGAMITTGATLETVILFVGFLAALVLVVRAADSRFLLMLAVVSFCAYLPFVFLGHPSIEGTKIDRWGFVPIAAVTLMMVSLSKIKPHRAATGVLTVTFCILSGINVLQNQVIANKPHILAAGPMPSTLLRRDGGGRVWNFMGGLYGSVADSLQSTSAAHWSYLKKSANSEWGFFPLRYPPQAYIHGLLDVAIFGRQAPSLDWRFATVDSRVSLEEESITRSFHIKLPVIPDAEDCYVYIHSKSNGIAIPANDCENVSLTRKLLNARIRSIDDLDQEFSVLAWAKSIDNPKTYWLTRPTVLDVPRLTGG